MSTPAQRIANPVPFTPAPFGLLSAAALVDVTERWAPGGGKYQGDPCGALGASLNPCLGTEVLPGGFHLADAVWGADAGDGKVNPVADCTWQVSTPFTLHASVTAAPDPGAPDANERAERLLVNQEPHALEHVLWTGGGVGLIAAGTVKPHLASPTAVNGATMLGGAVEPVTALAFLEAVIRSTYGGTPVIHANPGVVTLWSHLQLLTVQGNQLRTMAGSIVVCGGGYNATGPDGTGAAGAAWAYATGAVAVLRSPIYTETDPSRQRDRLLNKLRGDKARDYLLAIDACAGVVGVAVDEPFTPRSLA